MPYIEGYLDRYSVVPGQTISLHASSNGRETSVRILREGAPEREVLGVTKLSVSEHPVPERAWEVGPGWPACWQFTIPSDWASGVYRVELRAAGELGNEFTRWGESHATHPILLVVRAARPASTSKILLQLVTNTYSAYNPWGGKSTYSYNTADKIQAARVTLLRPGHGHFHTSFGHWERPFVRWCDEQNITLEYATNYDLHTWPAGFDDYRLILSVGHDEYWSAPMRDHLESFIARGGNAAFFSGNSVCWQVRFEDDGQTMVTYKEKYKDDPYYNGTPEQRRLTSTLFSHPAVGRPENKLTGVGFPRGGYHRSHGVMMDGSGAYTVQQADHWLFEGTGLKNGDNFGGENTIVGYECDGCRTTTKDGKLVPTYDDGTPASFQILAHAPADWGMHNLNMPVFFEAGYAPGAAIMGIHQTARGGTVVTSGSTDWSHGLGKDAIVNRITRNVLGRLGT